MGNRVTQAAATAPARPDAFLSYSRHDRDYVEARLADALEAAGKDVWVDLDDIRGGASDWRATVWRGIEASRVVVFVLSPDSLASRVCGEELAHATSLNKRIIPVLHRSVDGAAVPEALSTPNWILGRDSDDFATTVATLVTALETDEPWLDMHARLTQRTAEWLRMDRDHSYLLRGRDLRAAERWLDQREGHAESPTSDQIAYINAGRRASQRRQAMLLGGVVVALAVSIVLGVIAYVQRQTARSQSFAAQAIDVTGRDPERGLQLALDAAGLRKGALVTRALRTSLVASGWTHILRDDEDRPINDVAFSPDGRRAVLVGDDGSASVWDAASGKRMASLSGHRAAVNSVAFSPDGRRIATGAADGTARIWDPSGRQQRVLRAPSDGPDVWNVAFDAKGQRLITSGDRGAARVWDLATGSSVALAGAGADRLVSIGFSPDGNRALTPGRGGSLRVWRIAPRPEVTALLRPGTAAGLPMTVARFAPDGRHVLAAYGTAPEDPSGAMCLWALPSRRPAWCRSQTGTITDAAFGPGGAEVVGVSDAGTMVVRDVRDGASVGQMPRGGPINAVSYSADGKHILAAGDDRTARIFSSRGHPEHVLSGHTDAVNAAVYSPNGRDVLTGSADGSARIWSARQGETALPGTVAQASFAFSPDGRRLLAVGSKGRAVIWDTRHPGAPVVLDDGMPNPLGYVPPCGRATGCAAWSPDSRHVAGLNPDFKATIWDARTGKPASLRGSVGGAAFLPDGRLLVLGQASGAIVVNPASATSCAAAPLTSLPVDRRLRARRCAKLPTKAPITSVALSRAGRILTVSGGHIALWDSDGRSISGRATQPGPVGAVQVATMTPDGRRLAVAIEDGVQAYTSSSGRWRAAAEPPHEVSGLAFDRAGKRLLGIGDDRTVRVWDVEHLDHAPQILRHAGAVLDAQFSPTEELLLTAGADGMARVWDLSLEAALQQLRTSAQGGARFSDDGRVIALGGPAAARLAACEICAPPAELVTLARERLPDG